MDQDLERNELEALLARVRHGEPEREGDDDRSPGSTTTAERRAPRGRAVAVSAFVVVLAAGAAGYALFGRSDGARVASERRRGAATEQAATAADTAIDRVVAEAEAARPEAPPPSAGTAPGELATTPAGSLDTPASVAGFAGTVDADEVGRAPSGTAAAEPPDEAPAAEGRDARGRSSAQSSMWYGRREPDVSHVATSGEAPRPPRAVAKPTFGTMLPVRALGRASTLRTGGLARFEVTRDTEGRGWRVARGTIVVAIVRGSEHDRAFFEVVGLVDPAANSLLRVGGELTGTDGASGIRGKRHTLGSVWSRVFGELFRRGTDVAARVVVGRSGAPSPVVITDVARAQIPVGYEFSDVARRKEWVEIRAGTESYMLVTDLPRAVEGLDAIEEMSGSDVDRIARVDATRERTGLSDEELTDLVRSGSPDEIRRALPRMPDAWRTVAETALRARKEPAE